MNQPMRWSPLMVVAAVPVVISGVIGLLLCAILVLGLLALGMKPTGSL